MGDLLNALTGQKQMQLQGNNGQLQQMQQFPMQMLGQQQMPLSSALMGGVGMLQQRGFDMFGQGRF